MYIIYIYNTKETRSTTLDFSGPSDAESAGDFAAAPGFLLPVDPFNVFSSSAAVPFSIGTGMTVPRQLSPSLRKPRLTYVGSDYVADRSIYNTKSWVSHAPFWASTPVFARFPTAASPRLR